MCGGSWRGSRRFYDRRFYDRRWRGNWGGRMRCLGCWRMISNGRVRLAFDGTWLEANPLTATALREEVNEWARIGEELKIPGLDDIVLAQEPAIVE